MLEGGSPTPAYLLVSPICLSRGGSPFWLNRLVAIGRVDYGAGELGAAALIRI